MVDAVPRGVSLSFSLPRHALSILGVLGDALWLEIEALEVSEGSSVLSEDALEEIEELEPAAAERHSPVHRE